MNHMQKTSFIELYEELSSLLEQDNVATQSFAITKIDRLLEDNYELLIQACNNVNNHYKTDVVCASSVILFLQNYWKTRNNTLIKLARVYQSNSLGHRWNYFNNRGESPLVSEAKKAERKRLENAEFDITGSYLCFTVTFYSAIVKSNNQKYEIIQKLASELALNFTETEMVNLATGFECALRKNNTVGVCVKYASGTGGYAPFAYKAFSTNNNIETAASEPISTTELTAGNNTMHAISDQIITNKGEISADALAKQFIATNNLRIEGDQYFKICEIVPKIGYDRDSWATRLQKIVNSAIQERYLANKFTSLVRKSRGLFGGKSEDGTDFIHESKVTIEAKIYITRTNMLSYTKAPASATFHKADFVCCYILDETPHWQWLKKNANNPDVYDETDQPDFLSGKLDDLTMCECSQDKVTKAFIFSERNKSTDDKAA